MTMFNRGVLATDASPTDHVLEVYFRIQIEDEILHIVSATWKGGATRRAEVRRGQEGTEAVPHAAGTEIVSAPDP